MLQRWSKLERDFRNKSGRYDISKIPDIYDCVKYDTQHNATLGLEDTLELFRLSRALADIVIPQVRGRRIPTRSCLPAQTGTMAVVSTYQAGSMTPEHFFAPCWIEKREHTQREGVLTSVLL